LNDFMTMFFLIYGTTVPTKNPKAFGPGVRYVLVAKVRTNLGPALWKRQKKKPQ